MALAPQLLFEFADIVAGEAFYALDNFSVANCELRSSRGFPVGTRSSRGQADVGTWIVARVNDLLKPPVPENVFAFRVKWVLASGL
ncbi:hypothetical protein OH764_35450 (plasmid) [Burkholderia sp. M6-3]